MIWIFLLFSLTSTVCAFIVKRPQSVYEAEEDGNITIRWGSQIQTDLSRAIMRCVFRSDVTKILYKMIRGVEDSESQDEQFAGRVQIDRDSLRRGEIRLHLSRVTVKDSGDYSCDLTADYNKVLRRWELEISERFTLNVTQSFHSVNSDVFPTTPKPAEGTEGPKEKRYDWNKVKTVLGTLNVGVVIFGASVLLIVVTGRWFQRTIKTKIYIFMNTDGSEV